MNSKSCRCAKNRRLFATARATTQRSNNQSKPKTKNKSKTNDHQHASSSSTDFQGSNDVTSGDHRPLVFLGDGQRFRTQHRNEFYQIVLTRHVCTPRHMYEETTTRARNAKKRSPTDAHAIRSRASCVLRKSPVTCLTNFATVANETTKTTSYFGLYSFQNNKIKNLLANRRSSNDFCCLFDRKRRLCK